MFLASNLANHRLVGRAELVSHVILKPVPPNLSRYDDDFVLWDPDGPVTFWTKIHAQSVQPVNVRNLD